MTEEPPDHTHETAVESLQTLGLTPYTARIYVGLLRLGTGTAGEISKLVDVPRPRIYDGLDALHKRGLIDIQYASPRLFRPAPPARAIRHFQTTYDETIKRLRDLLADLEPVHEQPTPQHVETITGQDTVDERVPELLDEATTEILYQAPDEELTETVIKRLTAATDRGVTVRLAATGAFREQLEMTVPDATVIDSPWDGAATAPTRLLLIDQETALVSTIQHHSPAEETALWASGEHNSLVALLTECID